MVSIQFWDDPGSSNDPGAPIGLPFDVSLTGADDVLHEVTLGDDVVVNGPFRVGIEFFHDGPPSIARDTDGTITSDRNFICANFGAECVWFRSSTFGVAGDWVIRATIVPEPGQTGLFAGLVLIAGLARARGAMTPSTPLRGDGLGTVRGVAALAARGPYASGRDRARAASS
jgi:hypothetical protein